MQHRSLQHLLRRIAPGFSSPLSILPRPTVQGYLIQRTFAVDGSQGTPGPPEPEDAAAVAERTDSGLGASTSAPEAPARRKGKRPIRAEKGSWVDNPGLTDEIFNSAPVWPENVPVYDIQSQAPWLNEPVNPVIEAFKRLREKNPERLNAILRLEAAEDPPPRPGARKILEWELNVVFEEGPLSGEPHPLNKKAKCRVYLRDLQQEFGLSDAALQHIALICGPRYNPSKGLLTLTSERYLQREENRLHITQMLKDLVQEGQRAYPSEDQQQDAPVRETVG